MKMWKTVSLLAAAFAFLSVQTFADDAAKSTKATTKGSTKAASTKAPVKASTKKATATKAPTK